MQNITDTYRHKGLRNKLITILQKKGIHDTNVLKAINTIPRHYFFDEAFLEHAYEDKAFPIDDGQTISQPYTVARQTELLKVSSGDKVLEIGTGSGYQCAVLSHMNANVFSIERHQTLHLKAKFFLKTLGLDANLFLGDGTVGLPKHAPFERILVTAGAPTIPNSLLDQLAVGGIMVIPVGDNKKQEMIRITKTSNNKLKRENFGAFSFVPLKGKEGW